MQRTSTGLRENGFTLMELLVVIAIIAILCGILFPVFLNAKAKAQQTSCMNNLSQLGKSVRMYLDDYGCYPGAASASDTLGGNWILLIPGTPNRADLRGGGLFKYVRSTRSYMCPSDRFQSQNKTGCSYAMNAYLGGTPRLMESYVPQASKTVLMVCQASDSLDPPVNGKTLQWNDGAFDINTEEPSGVHNDGDNVVFCDTHTRWVKQKTAETLMYLPR